MRACAVALFCRRACSGRLWSSAARGGTCGPKTRPRIRFFREASRSLSANEQALLDKERCRDHRQQHAAEFHVGYTALVSRATAVYVTADSCSTSGTSRTTRFLFELELDALAKAAHAMPTSCAPRSQKPRPIARTPPISMSYTPSAELAKGAACSRRSRRFDAALIGTKVRRAERGRARAPIVGAAMPVRSLGW